MDEVRLRPTPAQLFVYGLLVALLVFAARCRSALLVLAAVNGIPGFVLGARRFPVLAGLFFLGVLGTFMNSLLVANTGAPVLVVGPVTVREGALNATVNITLRFLALAGVSFLFASTISPREAIRSLEEELGLPKGIAFSVAFGLRLLGLAQHDAGEILAVRRMRGARRVPLGPRDYESLLAPLLSIMLERAYWVGISAELRGFGLRPSRRGVRLVPTLGLVVLLVAGAVQVWSVISCLSG